MNNNAPNISPQQTHTNWVRRSSVLSVTALAFYVRLHALTLFQFHIDEFFTLTAAELITKLGVPLFPTGLFYDPGLLYSYIDGGLFWLLGFSEALGRWPAVIFGTLAVVTLYWLGARILRSPAVGLLAAVWLALSLESIEWSGRARMITLAQWLGLMSIAWLWLGLTRDSVRHRLLFALSYGGTLLTHFSTVVLMPAWIVAAITLWWAKVIRWQRVLARDALFLLLAFSLAVSVGVIFQPPPSVEFQQSDSSLEAKFGVLTNKFLQIPSDVGHAWEAYGAYFLDIPHGPILALALMGLTFSLTRLVLDRSQRDRGLRIKRLISPDFGSGLSEQPAKDFGHYQRDTGALFLGAIFLTAMLALILVINPHWQRARYLLMQIQGVFLLLGAHGCRELIHLLYSKSTQRRPTPTQKQPLWSPSGAIILAGLLSIPFVSALEPLIEAEGRGWNRYDQAFGYVRDNLADGEKVMSMHPPASLLYLNQSDYYLVQSSPKLIIRPDGTVGDRYSGASWLQTAGEFNKLIREPNRIWLVTQEFWLFNSYDGYLQQQILWQMDKLWGEGGVWALASRPGIWPLAQEAETRLNAEFDGGTRLLGFTAKPPIPAPGDVMHLTLFWQGAIPIGAKVFVQMRDANNGTVAQADHFIYDGKVPASRWPALLKNDTAIRDGATLIVPSELTPGPYRVVIGFYHPETFERLGVVNDQSGENAAILQEWVIK
jgi:hypothetical protein